MQISFFGAISPWLGSATPQVQAASSDKGDPPALAFLWGPCMGSLPLLPTLSASPLCQEESGCHLKPNLPLIAKFPEGNPSGKKMCPSYHDDTSSDAQNIPPVRITFRGLTYFSENVVHAHYGDTVRATVHKKILSYRSRPKMPVKASACLLRDHVRHWYFQGR